MLDPRSFLGHSKEIDFELKPKNRKKGTCVICEKQGYLYEIIEGLKTCEDCALQIKEQYNNPNKTHFEIFKDKSDIESLLIHINGIDYRFKILETPRTRPRRCSWCGNIIENPFENGTKLGEEFLCRYCSDVAKEKYNLKKETCFKCGYMVLDPINLPSNKDNKNHYFCYDCVSEKPPKPIRNPFCENCGKEITGRRIHLENGVYCLDCFIEKEKKNEIKICYRCKEPHLIKNMKKATLIFHTPRNGDHTRYICNDCLTSQSTCKYCGKELSDEIFIIENKIACKECSERPLCAVCHTPILNKEVELTIVEIDEEKSENLKTKKLIHNTCIPLGYEQCEICGLVYDKKYIENVSHEGKITKMCDWCVLEVKEEYLLTRCSMCDTFFTKKSELQMIDKKYYCKECLDKLEFKAFIIQPKWWKKEFSLKGFKYHPKSDGEFYITNIFEPNKYEVRNKEGEWIRGNTKFDIEIAQKIIVVGAGGLGSWTTIFLSYYFPDNTIITIDFDTVEESNLNRQPYANFINQSKVNALHILLYNEINNKTIFPIAKKADAKLIDQINKIKKVKILIDCTDDIKTQREIFHICKKLHIEYYRIGSEKEHFTITKKVPIFDWDTTMEETAGRCGTGPTKIEQKLLTQIEAALEIAKNITGEKVIPHINL